MTAALEGVELSAARPGHTLAPGKTRCPFYRRLGGPQGRSGRAENFVSTGIRSRTAHLVVRRYIDWATRPTKVNTTKDIFLCKFCRHMLGARPPASLFENIINIRWQVVIWSFSLCSFLYSSKAPKFRFGTNIATSMVGYLFCRIVAGIPRLSFG